MRDQSLSKISVMLFDPVPANRRHSRDALLTLGVRDLELPKSLEAARTLLALNDFNLLILDATDGADRICGTISELRHGSLGGNPFIVILATMWNHSAGLVRKLVDAGVDDVVQQPVSAGLLQTRIRQQVYARKLFVVTATYIGPDRRGDHRTQSGDVCISVPNSLREKLVGTASAAMIADAITKARAVVTRQRVAQAAFKITVYCALLREARESGPAVQSDIAAMKSTVANLVQWANAVQSDAIVCHCERLSRIAQQADVGRTRRSLGQIAAEGRAIQRALDPRKDDDCLNAEAAEAARRLAARRAIEATPMAASLGESCA